MHRHGADGIPPAPTGFASRPAGWPPAPSNGQSRALTYVALAIAVIATVLAVIGWYRPTPPPPAAHPPAPVYTAQQIADAKTRACSALDVVNKGAVLHSGTGAPAQQSSDPAMAEAQAADSRLSIIAGGWYLRDHIGPATPPEIKSTIEHLSEVALDMGQNYLAGVQNNDAAQANLIKEGNSTFARALELCK